MTTSENHLLPQILTLSKKLITIPSTTYDLEISREVLALAKKELEGYFPMEEFESNGIPSVLFHNTTERTRHFKIILNAHLDVVPGTQEQYHPMEKNGKLYGRGTYDMKAAAAAMILLFKNLAKTITYPLALQLVTDEETGSYHGTSVQIEKGIRADFVIAGEGGSSFNIKNETKGIVYVKLTTKGKECHSGYPWLGDNAVLKMQEVIAMIKKEFPLITQPEWKTIATITNIKTSNTVFNKIPADCSLYVDIRYIRQEKDTIVERLRQILPEDVSIEILHRTSAAYTPPQNLHLMLLKRTTEDLLKRNIETTVAYASGDTRLYNEVGCAGVEFGPLGANHHADNEWVDIQSLADYYHILKNFLLAV